MFNLYHGKFNKLFIKGGTTKMKKRILGIVVFLIALFLSFGKAQAIGIIDLDTTVNPNYAGTFSGLGDTTGTAITTY